MTNPWSESTEKAVLYPDDLAGRGPLWIKKQEPLEAEDVPEDDANHGKWAELIDSDPSDYMAAPVQVRDLIGEAWAQSDGEDYLGIEIFEAERGPEAHAEWDVEGRVLDPTEPEHDVEI